MGEFRQPISVTARFKNIPFQYIKDMMQVRKHDKYRKVTQEMKNASLKSHK